MPASWSRHRSQAFDGIIAAGGDGTLFEVLNGLYQHERENRLPLGLIPVGTGNAFARELGLMPGDWARASTSSGQGDYGRWMWAGWKRNGNFYFLNIIGLGFPVDAMKTSKKLKMFGNRLIHWPY